MYGISCAPSLDIIDGWMEIVLHTKQALHVPVTLFSHTQH